MSVDGSAFLERMIGVCLATSILESRDQRLPMAEVIRVRWAAASNGDRTAGDTDTDTTISMVGVVDLDRGDLDLSLVLVVLAVSGMDMVLALGLGRCLERHSGIWRGGLVLALVASALVALVVLVVLADSVALDLGRVCLAEATSSMSC